MLSIENDIIVIFDKFSSVYHSFRLPPKHLFLFICVSLFSFLDLAIK